MLWHTNSQKSTDYKKILNSGYHEVLAMIFNGSKAFKGNKKGQSQTSQTLSFVVAPDDNLLHQLIQTLKKLYFLFNYQLT